ncbi:MAG: hypothetical protein K5739_05175 [Lachnospiraceae bacterium]|nr:hypothetical protein [Lachnospiraceae bacterium]
MAQETGEITFYVDDERVKENPDGSFDFVSVRGGEIPLFIDVAGTCPENEIPYSVKSSDESILSVKPESASGTLYAFGRRGEKKEYSLGVYFFTSAWGKADLIFRIGESTFTVHVYIMDGTLEEFRIKKAQWGTADISWDAPSPLCGALVYIRQKGENYGGKVPDPAAVAKPGQSSIKLTLSQRDTYALLLVPYMLSGQGERICQDYMVGPFFTGEYYWYGSPEIFNLKKLAEQNEETCIASAITAIDNQARGQKVSWHAVEDAISYQLLRSDMENGSYKKVADCDASKTQAAVKASRGNCYYYRLRVIYPDGSFEDSQSRGLYYPMKKTPKKKAVASSINQTPKKGQYSEWKNWSCADETYYYVKDGKLHVVVVEKTKLLDYTLSSKLKVKNKKTIRLPKHDTWGAFYHGEDGNNYVAFGFLNENDDPDKEVIRIVQYSGTWKKKKTCKIKGGVEFVFPGIWDQFKAGNGRMAMDGDRLVLLCPRGMFAGEDGVKHQSNIGFDINTKNMSFQVGEMYYVSHSFNQFVRFQDGVLYQADHGDAYPRAVNLAIIKPKDPDEEPDVLYPDSSKNQIESTQVFPFTQDDKGNYTGTELGGMEVGTKHVLMTGRSVPHDQKISGVKGDEETLGRNIFLCVTDKKEKKTDFIWLTGYDPKKGKPVSESRIIKVSEDRFAVLFSTSKKNGSDQKLHYVLVDDSGKILKKKTYRNMYFTGGVQPLLYRGSIFWSESFYEGISKKVMCYSIPILE